MAAGAVLVAALALAVEALLGALQRLIVSPGLRTAQPRRRAPRQAPVVAGGIAS
jgi:osmoprotectant transport system permease protein